MTEGNAGDDSSHRRFAVACNNRTWDLLETPDRSEAQSREMLHAAHSSAYHWAIAGTPLNVARADLTVSRVYAALGWGGLAREFAARCMRYCESNHVEDWDIAFAHVAMAHAEALLGNRAEHRRAYELAQTAIARVAKDGDREVVAGDFRRVPPPE